MRVEVDVCISESYVSDALVSKPESFTNKLVLARWLQVHRSAGGSEAFLRLSEGWQTSGQGVVHVPSRCWWPSSYKCQAPYEAGTLKEAGQVWMPESAILRCQLALLSICYNTSIRLHYHLTYSFSIGHFGVSRGMPADVTGDISMFGSLYVSHADDG